MSFSIRKAEKKDLSMIGLLARTTFRDTWTSVDGPMLVEQYIQANLTDLHFKEFLETGPIQVLIAFHGSNPAGYAKLVYNKPPDKRQDQLKYLYLDKLYILKNFQNQGLGILFMDFIENLALQKNFDRIWMGGLEIQYKGYKTL